MAARARARAFRQFARIAKRLRGGASGASHLSATIVSALVHDYVSSTLFRFVIFVFRPTVACQLSPLPPSYYSTRHRLLLRSTRGIVRIRPYGYSFFFERFRRCDLRSKNRLSYIYLFIYITLTITRRFE